MSDADDPTESTPTTESVDAVGDASAADPAPDLVDSTSANPVRTVTRKGAAAGVAGALAVGGLIGWLGAGAFDDDPEPISAFQQGGFDDGQGPGRGFPGGGFPGGPGGGFPGGEHGPGGGWEGDGDHPTPPWMEEDGDDDRRDEYDDEFEDQDESDQDQQDDSDEDQEEGNQDQSDDA